MPGYKTHLGVGLFVACVLSFVFWVYADFELLGFWWSVLLVGAFFSLLPDIDTQASKVRLFLTLFGLIGLFINIIFKKSVYFDNVFVESALFIVLLLLIWVLPLISGFKHRQFSHSFIAAFLFTLPIYYLNIHIGIISSGCYISHLSLDKLLKN